jgi:hypothetical protein
MNNTKLLVENWRSYLNENEVLNEEESVIAGALKTLATVGIVGALLIAADEYGNKKRMESIKDHPEIAKHVKQDENATITKTKDGKKILTVMGADGQIRKGEIK